MPSATDLALSNADSRVEERSNRRRIVVFRPTILIVRESLVIFAILIVRRGGVLVVSGDVRVVFGRDFLRSVVQLTTPAPISSHQPVVVVLRQLRRLGQLTCLFRAIDLRPSFASEAVSSLSRSRILASRSSSSRSCRSISSSLVLISCSITQSGSSLSASDSATARRTEATTSARACAFASRKYDSEDEISESDFPCAPKASAYLPRMRNRSWQSATHGSGRRLDDSYLSGSHGPVQVRHEVLLLSVWLEWEAIRRI